MKSLGNWQIPSFPGREQNQDIHDMKENGLNGQGVK